MFKLFTCFLIFIGCSSSSLQGVETPEGLSDKSAYLIKKFDSDAAKERAAAEREVKKMRDKLIVNLKKEMKAVTKKGKLEEALSIKSVIEGLQQNQREEMVDIFGNKVVSKPKLEFIAAKSMPLFKVGTKMGPFPAMLSVDPLGVFEGKPLFFNQQMGSSDVVYEVHLPKSAKRLLFEGGAVQNMTIVITDPKGEVLGSGGPWGGGNKPLNFKVDFKPSKEFVITISNHIGSWFHIKSLKFE
jgi:hypothetical protein